MRRKGPLGKEYPHWEYLMEGDTPSFLNLINNGLSDHDHPDWGGWGGRYEFYTPRRQKWFLQDETRPFWSDADDEVIGKDGHWYDTNHATIWRWREAYQNDFAARMDWTIKSYEEANHPPVPDTRTFGSADSKAWRRDPAECGRFERSRWRCAILQMVLLSGARIVHRFLGPNPLTRTNQEF